MCSDCAVEKKRESGWVMVGLALATRAAAEYEVSSIAVNVAVQCEYS